MDLRPYQKDARGSALSGLLKGQNRLLWQMPTGTGKTVVFASLVGWEPFQSWAAQWPRRGASMLVIAHREELLEQAADTIRQLNPGLMVSIEQAGRVANRFSDVVVASIQTLAARRFERLRRLLELHDFRLVVVDEAHHAAAASYRTALVHLGFLPKADASDDADVEAASHQDVSMMAAALEGWDQTAPKDRLLLGVTATPNRTDAIGLGCVFQSIAYSYRLKQAIDDGWLVPIKPWVVETAASLDEVRITHGEFNQKDLAATVNTPERNLLTVESWRQFAPGVPTIAFTVDVQHAVDLSDVFRRQGVRSEVISGETPKEERRDILRRYTAGDVDVLCNCMVLTEGTDLPRTGCILHAKPTKSATLYEQMTGRGLRLFDGKKHCLVIDVVDIARKHTLQAAPVLFGLPPGLKTNGQDLRATADALEALREQFPEWNLDALLASGRFSIEELQKRASTFDVWKVQDLGAFGKGRALNWILSGASEYRLSYPWSDGTETLQVAQNLLGQWEVICTLTPRGPGGRRQKTIAAGIDTADHAAGLAEKFVLQERRSIVKLKGRDAGWRKNPASEKQLAVLRRAGIPFGKTITGGEASDLISLRDSRRGR